MILNSIEAIKIAANKSGNHFFDRDTMRLFNSRIGKTAYRAGTIETERGTISRAYFVTSERYDYAAERTRRYTVRLAILNTDPDFYSMSIQTVGEYLQYGDSKTANKVAKRLAEDELNLVAIREHREAQESE